MTFTVGKLVFQLHQCLLCCAAWHGQPSSPLCAVPIQCCSDALFGVMVNFEGVHGSHRSGVVFQISIMCVLDEEIIHDRGETRVFCFVLEASFNKFLLVTASSIGKVSHQIIMCNLASLLQTTPCLIQPGICKAVACFCMQSTFHFDCFWDQVKSESDAFRLRQQQSQTHI